MAKLKFLAFIALCLGLPGGMMAWGDPRLADLGKLALILTPAAAGLALHGGLGDRGVRPRWPGVALAAGVTLAVAAAALAIAFAAGAARLEAQAPSPHVWLAAAGLSALTSVLEELGWAGGGLALATAAFGRRWGVAALGLTWAAWHLIPAVLKVGLFPELETAPAPMLLLFLGACLIYRELLTTLREQARTWWAAAAGHAAPNILLAGAMSAGLGRFDTAQAWPFFPAPGGLFFPALALAALVWVRRRPHGI